MTSNEPGRDKARKVEPASPEARSIGIATLEESRERTIAIASGKRKRDPDEPRIWITPETYLDRMRENRPRAIQPHGDYDPTIDAYCCWALAIEELYKRSIRLLEDDHR